MNRAFVLRRLGKRLILFGIVCGLGSVVLLLTPDFIAALLGQTESTTSTEMDRPFPTTLVVLGGGLIVCGLGLLRVSKR